MKKAPEKDLFLRKSLPGDITELEEVEQARVSKIDKVARLFGYTNAKSEIPISSFFLLFGITGRLSLSHTQYADSEGEIACELKRSE